MVDTRRAEVPHRCSSERGYPSLGTRFEWPGQFFRRQSQASKRSRTRRRCSFGRQGHQGDPDFVSLCVDIQFWNSYSAALLGFLGKCHGNWLEGNRPNDACDAEDGISDIVPVVEVLLHHIESNSRVWHGCRLRRNGVALAAVLVSIVHAPAISVLTAG